MTPTAMSATNVIRPCAMISAGTHTSCQSGPIDNAKSRMLLLRVSNSSRYLREKRDG